MDTIHRLDICIGTDRDLDQAKTALLLLKRGNVAVRHARIGHRGDLPELSGHNIRTLLTAVYSVLAEGGSIDISLKESVLLPIWLINHWNLHSPAPARSGPIFFQGHSFSLSSDEPSRPVDSAIADMQMTDQDIVVARMMTHFRLHRAARTIQRRWRKVVSDPYGKVGKRVLLKWFHREKAPKRQRLE